VPTDSSLIGRTLAGRYTITGHIGQGGFAAVYRGVKEDGEPRDVAVKVMNPELAADPRFLRRFRREARAAVRLKHPSSVRVLEYGVDGDLAFIAMELLAGQDLFAALSRERRLPEVRAIRIVAQICDALEAAHAEGIVHRDLKPENVMLIPDGAADGGERVKVLDFGVAKILHRESAPARPTDDPPSSTHSALTRSGTVMGTPAYVSPEQGRAEPIDARSDIYACGVLLYQLVTGRLPFDGETGLAIVMQHVHQKPRPPSEIVLALNSRLEAIILRALSKSPADRQQSASDLAADLRATLPELTSSQNLPLVPRASSEAGSVVITPGPNRRPMLQLDTPVSGGTGVPASASPNTDSTRTVIRDAAAMPPAARIATPPPRSLGTAPTPLVVEVPQRGSSPGPPPTSTREPTSGRTGDISTLRSRLEDVAPEIALLAKQLEVDPKPRVRPPPPPPERPPDAVPPAPVTVRKKPRLSVPAAVALGIALGLLVFALATSIVVLIIR